MIKSRAYLTQNIFAFWLGFAAVFSAVIFFGFPSIAQGAAVGALEREVEYGWITLYGLGGGLTVAGILMLSARLELAGMSAFTAALLIAGVAGVVARGWISLPNSLILWSLCLACIVRARVLIEAYNIDREKRDATRYTD